MLEEQQGTTYRLTDELAAKEEQILRLKSALDLRKAGQGDNAHLVSAYCIIIRLCFCCGQQSSRSRSGVLTL